jgi:hypothetical protein
MHHLGRQNYCVERPIKPSERTVCGRKTLRKEKKTLIVVTYIHFKHESEGATLASRVASTRDGSPRSAITL